MLVWRRRNGIASVLVFKAEATDWLRGDRQQPSGFGQRVSLYGHHCGEAPSRGLELVSAMTAGRSLPGFPKGSVLSCWSLRADTVPDRRWIVQMEIPHPLTATAAIVVLANGFRQFLTLLVRRRRVHVDPDNGKPGCRRAALLRGFFLPACRSAHCSLRSDSAVRKTAECNRC